MRNHLSPPVVPIKTGLPDQHPYGLCSFQSLPPRAPKKGARMDQLLYLFPVLDQSSRLHLSDDDAFTAQYMLSYQLLHLHLVPFFHGIHHLHMILQGYLRELPSDKECLTIARDVVSEIIDERMELLTARGLINRLMELRIG